MRTKLLCNFNIFRNIHPEIYIPKPPWKVLFFGTDEFSLYSLENLYHEYKSGTLLDKLEVCTTVKQRPNPVHRYAERVNLNIYPWPRYILDSNFDVGLVVSFGHLIPASVIKHFPLGILNVHASLLPRWRGAAPIIYALANADTETGVSIMSIKPKQFDVGDILMQEKMNIPKDITLPELHEMLGRMGARCLLKSLQNLPELLSEARPQSNEGVTLAPKVSSEFAVIRWMDMSSTQIYNLERATKGLFSPTCSWHGTQTKLLGIEDCGGMSETEDIRKLSYPGSVRFEKKTKTLRILCSNRTVISVRNVGVLGKRVMNAADFNNGFLSKELIERRMFS